jgi:hypothetical protein
MIPYFFSILSLDPTTSAKFSTSGKRVDAIVLNTPIYRHPFGHAVTPILFHCGAYFCFGGDTPGCEERHRG